MELDAKIQNPQPAIRNERPFHRLPLLLCLLALLVVVGGIEAFRSPWYHERMLRRMSTTQLQQWTARHSDDATAHSYLGLAYQHAGKLRQAGEEYIRALNLNPTLDSARTNLAGVLVLVG